MNQNSVQSLLTLEENGTDDSYQWNIFLCSFCIPSFLILSRKQWKFWRLPSRHGELIIAFHGRSSCRLVGFLSCSIRLRPFGLYRCTIGWSRLAFRPIQDLKWDICETNFVLYVPARYGKIEEALICFLEWWRTKTAIIVVTKVLLLFRQSAAAVGNVEQFAFVQRVEVTEAVSDVYRTIRCEYMWCATADEIAIKMEISISLR